MHFVLPVVKLAGQSTASYSAIVLPILNVLTRRDPEVSLGFSGLSLAGIEPKTRWFRARHPKPWIKSTNRTQLLKNGVVRISLVMKYYLDTQPHIWWVFSTLPLTVQFVKTIYMYYDTIEYLQNKGWRVFPFFKVWHHMQKSGINLQREDVFPW